MKTVKNLLDFRGELQQDLEVDIYDDVEHEEFYTSGFIVGFNDVGNDGTYYRGDTRERVIPVTIEIEDEVSNYFGTTVDYIRFNKKALM